MSNDKEVMKDKSSFSIGVTFNSTAMLKTKAKKLKMDLAYDPAIGPLGICQQNLLSYFTDTYSVTLIAIIFTKSYK